MNKEIDKEVIKRGNVSTLFSIGTRIKSTGSIIIIDFLDVDDLNESHIVSSVALEIDTVENLIEGLQNVLDAIKND